MVLPYTHSPISLSVRLSTRQDQLSQSLSVFIACYWGVLRRIWLNGQQSKLNATRSVGFSISVILLVLHSRGSGVMTRMRR